jgi:hypothetical protein
MEKWAYKYGRMNQQQILSVSYGRINNLPVFRKGNIRWRRKQHASCQKINELWIYTLVYVCNYVRSVPCHHGMARPQVADGGKSSGYGEGGGVAANILNKQSRTADKGWSSSLEIGRGTNNPSPWNFFYCYEMFQSASDLDWFFGTT